MAVEIPHNAVIVVADGESARFFRNTGNGGTVSLKADGNLQPSDLEDDGPSGKQNRRASTHEKDEATFVKQLANDLYRRAQKNEFEALVVIADPHTLGTIRPLLHKEVRDRIIGEHAKTLTNATIEDIEKAL